MSDPMPIAFELLTPAHIDAWLAFFDGPAFADNPAWGSCYCRCLVFGAQGAPAWERACAAPGENRRAMIAAIGAGQIDGVLAFRDGEPVGWLQFGPAPRFISPVGTAWGDEPDAGAVACFVVASAHRGGGLARAMLVRALAAMARRGFRQVHAIALREDTPEAMHQFTGPRGIYLAEGFRPTDAPAPGASRVRLSRALGPVDALLEPVGRGAPRQRHLKPWLWLWGMAMGGDYLGDVFGIFADPHHAELDSEHVRALADAALRSGAVSPDGARMDRLLSGPFHALFAGDALGDASARRQAYHQLVAAAAGIVAPLLDAPGLAEALAADAAARLTAAPPLADADALVRAWYADF